ncbi:MAG: sugar ABC transporter substrate-binding protein [Spirochaetia bacterium]|nr:sugar ABC transporter substrate-binding protein [Spirochaetia bacterium]MCF7952849.1 sugar ABC transporter substrate-binding protein [Spirochaetales bacterium]
MRKKSSVLISLVLALAFIMTGTMIFAQGQQDGGEVTINLALANNPLSQALARIAGDEYEAEGVNVNISVLPENDLRQRLTTEASTGGTTYDMFYIGPYEAQTWAKNGWLENLEPYFDGMSADEKAWYDRDDLIQGMVDSLSLDGEAYGLPFYGESSFTMYNKELFEKNGLEMPKEPTWEEVYELAKQIHDPANGIVGMTMRGAPGWGMSGAPFVTMVNAFGGRFFDMDWNATVDTPEQREAWKMYKNILRDAGQEDILSYTYNECIALMQSGKCGIYYDATSIAPPLESDESKVQGKMGYAFAPRQKLDKNTAWLWNWSMAINPKSSEAKKEAVFDFMLWATSKDFIKKTVELDPTGASTPPASRSSTYELPVYAAAPYAEMTLKTLEGMDFTNPTLKPVPYVGLQYIAIPEFANAGTKMTEYLADYVVDKISLDEAISKTQDVFEQVAEDGQYK